MTSDTLKIAVPNKGTLSEAAQQMLIEAGYAGRSDPRALTVPDDRNGVEFYFLRPRDIATYVAGGVLDIGITGRDLLLDSEIPAREVQALDFGFSTFRFAGPTGFDTLDALNGARVATSYPRLVERFLASHNVSAEIIRLDGAVESAVRLGVAEAVADVVSTGRTLKSQGLEIFGPVILESEAILIAGPDTPAGLETLQQRLQGVLVARQYVLMDYDLPARLLDEATSISPGIESPTVSPLQDPDWVAVRAMVKRDEQHDVMDKLYALGARAILVSSIHAARI